MITLPAPEGLDRVLALPWAAFNVRLMTLSEPDVERLYGRELARRRRLTVLLRLQARGSRLRRERERSELLADLGRRR